MWEGLSDIWRVCFELAWSASRAGSAFIGAAVTDPDGRVVSVGSGHMLSTGRIRIFHNGVDQNPLDEHPLAHAELQALLSFDYSETDPRTCVLYTTMEPCPLCIGAICMANVREFHYACRDPWAGSVGLLQANRFIQRQGMSAFGPENETLENIITAVWAEGMLRRKRRRLVDSRYEVAPRAAAVGEMLLNSNLLQVMRSAEMPASEVFDELNQLIQGQQPDGAEQAGNE